MKWYMGLFELATLRIRYSRYTALSLLVMALKFVSSMPFIPADAVGAEILVAG